MLKRFHCSCRDGRLSFYINVKKNTKTTKCIYCSKKAMHINLKKINVEEINNIFENAVLCWENGQKSNNQKEIDKCNSYRVEAERMLKEYKITVSYPGLYPVFIFGETEYLSLNDLINFES